MERIYERPVRNGWRVSLPLLADGDVRDPNDTLCVDPAEDGKVVQIM